MEKSIEKIWKEGFIKNDALIAPQLNNLYNRKSMHFINKYKRMFKLNIIWIVAGSFIVLILSFLVGIPFLGVPMFILLNTMAMVDRQLLEGLNKVNQNETSYEYLKSFLNWWDRKNKVNINMARILYPYVFLSMLLGMWFIKVEGNNLGAMLVDEILHHFPNMTLLFGIPLIGIIGVLIISSLLLYFSPMIYKSDINLVYGRVLDKIKTLVKDMEELRKGVR